VTDKALVRALVEAWGPSGYEDHVRALIRGYVEPLADEIRVDGAGNLICRMGKGGKKILIAAHMDEIGIVITHIDKDGYGRFTGIGELLPATLLGNRVRFENGTIGVIGLEGTFDISKQPKSLNEFFIDFSDGGASRIRVGDVAALTRGMEERGTRLIAKSMDDRIGCVVAIEAMRALKGVQTGNELYFVFTTQEEVGIRGAKAAAFGLSPDYGIALDVTLAMDTPKNGANAVKLGAGAAVKIFDVGHIVPPVIKDWVLNTAEAHGIPHQLEILTAGTTDAAAIQQTAAGIPSATLSIPTRFVHTTSETVDVNDVDACVKLLVALIERPVDM
jgi:endoglucanase